MLYGTIAFGSISLAVCSLEFWAGNIDLLISSMDNGTYNPYREFNNWINTLFFSWTRLEFISHMVMQKFGAENGYYAQCYLRDLVAGTAVYWITGGIWHFLIYNIFGKQLFADKGRTLPKPSVIREQQMLAQASLFVYAMLPVVSEWLIENRFTRTYFYIAEIGGWTPYFLYLALYIACVEVGVYWMHRTLHTNKFLYKYIHGLHHKYKTAQDLTPWSSIAFNPLDGILQASPYVICLTFIPVHYFTHIILLFFTGIWATNIHDAVWGDSEPIMGSKYHTVHHTHFVYNYGQFFVFCDWIWGTLNVPSQKADGTPLAEKKNKSK